MTSSYVARARWAFVAFIVVLATLCAVAANAQSQYPPQTPTVSSLGGLGGAGGGGGGGGGTITGGGASPQVAFWTGPSAISGDAGLTYDDVTDILGIGVSATIGTTTAGTDASYSQTSVNKSSAAHETWSILNSGAGSVGLVVTGDALLATTDRALTLTATLPTGNARAIDTTVTETAGTTSPFAWFHTLTGSNNNATPSISILIDNTTEHTASGQGLFGTHGDHGVEARSYSATNTSTSQANVGLVGVAWDSSAFNVGILSQSYGDPGVWTSPGAVNIGNLSTAYNGNNAGGLAVAGFFMLRNGQAGDPSVTTSAALLADNGDQNEDIFVARDNGAAQFKVGNNGLTTGNVASNATADLFWAGDTDANLLVVDVSVDAVGIGTATPGAILMAERTQNNATEIRVDNTDNGNAALAQVTARSGGSDYVALQIYSDTYAFPFDPAIPLADWGVVTSGSTTNGFMYVILRPDGTGLHKFIAVDPVSGNYYEAMALGNASAVFNDGQRDIDFRVESDTNANAIFVDASAETMLLMGGQASTGCTIDAAGNLTCAGTISGSGSLGGSGANTQVAFFTAATTLAGDANMVFNTGTGKLTVDNIVATNGLAATSGNLTANAGNVKAGWQFVGDDTLLTCAAGVATFNPAAGGFKQYVRVDANGAACAITIGETNATLATNVTFYIATSAGAGVVTFPDVANVHNGPTLCTTTGLTLQGSYSMTYANLADDAYLGVSCTQN